jgi:predicted ester cyclase
MRANKDVVEELLEAFNTNELDRVQGLFAPEFVNHNPPPFPGAGADRAGMEQAMRLFREAFPDCRAEIKRLIAEGDLVVAHEARTGTHEGPLLDVAATGKQATVELIHIFRVADGRIVEGWGLIDAMGLRQQLGVAPAMAEA